MASTAARVANYLYKTGGHWGHSNASIMGAQASTFGDGGASLNSVQVEAYLGTSLGWQKVPVRYESGISITRGRPAEGQNADTQTASITIDNRTGNWSPRNPMGAYFGYLGRNTPLRIWKGSQLRFWGEVSEWPQRWDTTGSDIYVPVVASGLLRRLGKSSDVATKSAMYRFHTATRGVLNANGTRVFPTDYWPMEDPNGSNYCINVMPGGQPMSHSGNPNFASYTGFQGSDALPVMFSAIGFTGKVRGTMSSNGFVVDILVYGNITTESGGGVELFDFVLTGGTARMLSFSYNLMASATFDAQLFDDAGTPHASGGFGGIPYPATVATQPQAYQFVFKQNGTKVNLAIYARASTDTVWQTLMAPFDFPVANTLGHLSQINMGANTTSTTSSQGTTMGIGHLAVYDDTVQHDISTAPSAYLGEAAGTRFARIASEEGYDARVVGEARTSVAMGYQTHDTLIALLRSCENSDCGILYEPRDSLSLAYRTTGGLENQAAILGMNYANAEVGDDLQPTDDDTYSANDVTVEREGSTTGRYIDSTSLMGTQAPPLGIGLYGSQTTLILNTDDQCVNLASWLVHLGTVNEARYPQITVNLNNGRFLANPDLQSRALVADVGDRITISNPPAWLPPEQISQIIQGYTETFDQFEHVIVFNCAPESPYRTTIVSSAVNTDGTGYKADGGSSTLAATVDSTTVTLSVATVSGSSLWTTSSGLPFDIMVAGERMTVTAISGTSSPQSFTVTRSVNAVVKSHIPSETVALFSPPWAALTQ